ncbi:MAG TPA: phosphoribosyltransferase family protein [Streptosporangiaceae bacterium]|nr:phosphoribosyltransferase family protein [Streptosporangiaceae bacterium]
MRFTDRTDAGRRLAEQLEYLRDSDVVVLGLPRGGVPVAFEVAQALSAPLDVLVVRKLGVPFQPELAMGAIGEGGVRVLNEDVIRRAGITDQEIAVVEERERADLDRQAQQFRAGRAGLDLAGRTVVVVDDGIATGSTASAACQVARQQGAAWVILAVPVGAPDSVAELRSDYDEVVCLEAPASFAAVGTWYQDFSHVPDTEVSELLQRAAKPRPATSNHAATQDPQASSGSSGRDEHVEVQAGALMLAGHLSIPAGAPGTVLFVHGSGSSRHSPRNRFVAEQFNEAGLGTLLFDLLTSAEELDRANVFDVETLASRLTAVTSWLRGQPGGVHTAIGYFGASTGAAAALWSAAAPDAHIDAVVSRGGRPDLAEARLSAVRAPTLLIVGERDEIVLDLNREAQRELRCENRLAIVPGATHLFEEPGALQTVTRLAREWFAKHFGAPAASRR